MIIKTLEVGPIMTNCYIVVCKQTNEAVVIDPGDEADRIYWELGNLKAKIKYIINTHGHFDHVGGNKELKEKTKADILINKLDEPMLFNLKEHSAMFGLSCENSPKADKYIDENSVVEFGEIKFKVFNTPGHTQGGVSLYDKDAVFVGDTLFASSIGRTDLPGGNHKTIIESIKTKLLTLPESTRVYPGHGPKTTIGKEKQGNPFLR